MEARSSTGVAALMARETERLTIGWGIIAASTRHPVQVAMDARVVQEAAGPGTVHPRLRDVEDLPQQHEDADEEDARPDARRGRRSCAACSRGERFEYDGDTWSADVPALQAEAHAPREVPPVYVAATAPKMQALAGEIGDGCLTPSITTPAFVRYTRENVARRTSTSAARRRLDPRDRPRQGPRRRARDRRHVPRQQGAEHPGRGRHAARPRRARAGRDPPGRRGDGAAAAGSRRRRR